MRLSFLLIPILAIGVSLSGAVAHPHDAPKSSVERQIEAQILSTREAIRAAAIAKDAATLKRLYAAEFSHTHGSGKMDGRDARIIALISGDPVIELAPVSDQHIHVHSGRTAIMTGRSPILNVAENKTYDFRWMQVYVQTGDGWTLAASQATRLPDQASQ